MRYLGGAIMGLLIVGLLDLYFGGRHVRTR